MEERRLKNHFEISPSQGPFRFHAWLELPFPLAVKVHKRFEVEYRPDVLARLTIIVTSNVFKVQTGSWWWHQRDVKEWVEGLRSGKESPPPRGWLQEYVIKDKVLGLVKKLGASNETRYVHVEETPAVVYLSSLIPDALIPKHNFDLNDLFPSADFFPTRVLPCLQIILDAYRISAKPWMRYTVQPVSEALTDEAFLYFTDRYKSRLISIHWGFDVKSSPLRILGLSSEIQKRFNRIFPRLSKLQSEDQMASAYYLFRMRRWTEAIAVASSVVDRLQRDLVEQLASTEIEATAILKAYRFQELFSQVFPAFGKPKLADENKTLWDNFVKAKEYRGSKLHGGYSKAFDKTQQKVVQKHLNTFDSIAQWLTLQMGHSWALDFHEKGTKLESFP